MASNICQALPLGNGALALMLTVTTNILGVFTVPYILNAVLRSASGGGGGDGDYDDGNMADNASKLLVKLVISILVPIAVGRDWWIVLDTSSFALRTLVSRVNWHSMTCRALSISP